MNRERLGAWLDTLGIVAVAAVALLLRSRLDYRTAFVDEASLLSEGWHMLRRQATYAGHYYMGWPALTAIPLGAAGWLGGVVAARALNAVLGMLTVVAVLLLARQAYGKATGYLAGAIYAVYGPAIFVGTFASYDALSVFLAGTGLCLWAAALRRRQYSLYSLGSLAMALAVLAKYAAVTMAAAGVACVSLGAAWSSWRNRGEGGTRSALAAARETFSQLLYLGLPLLILPAYAWFTRAQLVDVWKFQILSKQSVEPGALATVIATLARYAGLPLALGLLALLDRRRRAASLGLLLVGLSLLPYHLLNRDTSTLFKHTAMMMLGLAPAAAFGTLVAVRLLLGPRLAGRRLNLAAGALGLAVVAVLAVDAQWMLPGLRSYWPDTAEAMSYLQEALPQGATILMEQGQVGQYYLVERGRPGHIPARIYDTWWYRDEQGDGPAAYERAVVGQRFDWIVLDYTVTADLDRRLLPLMNGRYVPRASFPARIQGRHGRIDLFEKARPGA